MFLKGTTTPVSDLTHKLITQQVKYIPNTVYKVFLISQWKEAIVARFKSSNQKGLVIDFSLKARLNSTIQHCETFLSDLGRNLIKMTSQLRISYGSSMAQSWEVVFQIHRNALIWFLYCFSVVSILYFHEESVSYICSNPNYLWCFHFPSSMKLHCFITPLKSEIVD